MPWLPARHGTVRGYVVRAHIACIYRYPIKGLSAEPLHAVELAADRKFALANRTRRSIPNHRLGWPKHF